MAKDVREEKQREKGKQPEQKKGPPEQKKRKVIEGIRGIVRVAGVDIFGEKKLRSALLKIKGVGQSLAKSIPVAAGLDPRVMIGSLTDEQLEKIEDVVSNPMKYGIPVHMINRRSDPFVGGDRHLYGSDLSFTQKGDIDFMKRIRSYKGVRHELGQPVRGQRTRSSFRTGMIVGVAKGAAREAAKGAAPAAGAPAVSGAAPTTPVAGAKPGAPAPAAKPGAAPVKAAGPAPVAKKEEKKK